MINNSTSKKIVFQTPIGEIKAEEKAAVIKAFSIPYATAQRFKKPKAIKPYSEPVELTGKSPACPQNKDIAFSNIVDEDILKNLQQSEDCLNLSITRPNNKDERLPVMVWIHGGSYVAGAGDSYVFDPDPMVEEQNVIIVAVTYRLGLFGFLGDYNNIPANLGYLDIVEALHWINRNIESFGGDSNNITLFGQSAGGDAVTQMMLIKETENLFHNVIVQSSPFGLLFNKTQMINDMISEAKSLNKNAPIDEILSKQLNVITAAKDHGLKAGMPFGVQYGKYPFPEETEVYDVWRERANNINVLTGHTKNETALYIPLFPKARKIFQMPLLGILFKFAFITITTRLIYKKGCKKFAENCTTSNNNVYQYEISWGSKTNGYGAVHTIDIPLFFGRSMMWVNRTIVQGIKIEEIEMKGKEVRKLWADFARKGHLDDKGEIKNVLKYKKITTPKN